MMQVDSVCTAASWMTSRLVQSRIAEGEHYLSRLQAGLKPLSLYPNIAKTRIVTAEAYLHDAMAHENSVQDELTEDSSEPVPYNLSDGVQGS